MTSCVTLMDGPHSIIAICHEDAAVAHRSVRSKLTFYSKHLLLVL